MIKRKRLPVLLLAALSLGLTSTVAQATFQSSLEHGLTFFSDGTQILKTESNTVIKFNDGNVADDEQVISNYVNSADRGIISSVVRDNDNRAIDFNRVIITRPMLGTGALDSIAGTEVTIVYSNTGNVLETYDSTGEVRKYIHLDENTTHVDSSIYGYSRNNEEWLANVLAMVNPTN
ncbi:hypothetical protein VHA01S_029_00330 [Vibrio halioticoli NBRC 102217]|uniref:Uncharacterized protein n=1 Tax=Vibrio halioticoli NBRC 102217 TaxID=1219072 RepID=V5HL49_9VIBR|nr:hypothetical protein [Vibrio halioticoli]GAD89900.1 hypothetical protein VHA01S_029_00330 [Vibrio halioticoli NBRC 102217]